MKVRISVELEAEVESLTEAATKCNAVKDWLQKQGVIRSLGNQEVGHLMKMVGM